MIYENATLMQRSLTTEVGSAWNEICPSANVNSTKFYFDSGLVRYRRQSNDMARFEHSTSTVQTRRIRQPVLSIPLDKICKFQVRIRPRRLNRNQECWSLLTRV